MLLSRGCYPCEPRPLVGSRARRAERTAPAAAAIVARQLDNDRCAVSGKLRFAERRGEMEGRTGSGELDHGFAGGTAADDDLRDAAVAAIAIFVGPRRSAQRSPTWSAVARTSAGNGAWPTAKLLAAAKLPVPVPNRIETLLLLPFAAAMSS